MSDIPALQLSGRPHVVAGGRRIPLLATDALLLAWLALEGPSAREKLSALLWPDSSAEAARNALRQRLFRLRKQAGFELVEGGALLALAADVKHDLQGANGLLGDLSATESPALDAWLAERRGRLRVLSRQVQLQRIDQLETDGDTAAALTLALTLLSADPLSEDAHRRVMRLHYLLGDRSAAMLAFDRCEQVLKHEIGSTPSHETLALLATIEQQQAASTPAAASPRRALPAAVLRPPRLVGRDAELAALQRGLDSGHVVVLLGEAGMGKSRLLQALAAARPGVLHSSGRPGDQLVPYATIARALRQLLDRDPAAADPALRRTLAPLLPELPEWVDPAAPSKTPAALQTLLQTPLVQPVLTLLQRAARSVDVLALDDLHFADDATLELLQLLLAAPRASLDHTHGAAAQPRWCLGQRPAAPGSRLHGLLAALASAGPHTRLALQPLTEAHMAEFIDTLGLPGIDGGKLAATLRQRTGGNPLFALETLKLLWHEGAAAADLPRPESLAQLIGLQLARLSAPALQLARVAAVAGVDFCIPLAENMLGRSALDLADAWAELEAQQVLRGDSFAHDLIHDSVLQGLPEVIARHLHGQTASWLEAQGGDPAQSVGHAVEPARVAAHWEAAGQRARALPALRAAAERAHRALREVERISFLLHAADIAEAAATDKSRDEAFVLVRSAIQGHMNTIRQADGLPLLDRLQALARTPLQQAYVAADRAWYAAVLGDLAGAVALGESALAQVQTLDPVDRQPALAATVREHLGTALSLAGRFDEALTHMLAAEADIAQYAQADGLAAFHGNFAVVLDNLGRPADAQAHHLKALELSQAQGDQAQHATQLANYAASRIDAGDVIAAAAQAAAAQRIVTTFDMAGSSAGYIATLQAQCERARGRYTLALEWCDRAEAILAERNPARLPVARLHRAHVWLDLGQHARALQLLGGDALQAARRMPARYAVRWLLLLVRAQRRLHQRCEENVQPLLLEARTLSPAAGWPELGLLVRTEQALAEDATTALAALLAVAAEAARRRLQGAELGALLHACGAAAAAHDDRAAALAQQALTLCASHEALHVDRALRWLGPAQALAPTNPAQAQALALAGQQWLRAAAAAHLMPEFAAGFLHQHPANAALLAWHA